MNDTYQITATEMQMIERPDSENLFYWRIIVTHGALRLEVRSALEDGSEKQKSIALQKALNFVAWSIRAKLIGLPWWKRFCLWLKLKWIMLKVRNQPEEFSENFYP